MAWCPEEDHERNILSFKFADFLFESPKITFIMKKWYHSSIRTMGPYLVAVFVFCKLIRTIFGWNLPQSFMFRLFRFIYFSTFIFSNYFLLRLLSQTVNRSLTASLDSRAGIFIYPGYNICSVHFFKEPVNFGALTISPIWASVFLICF